MANPTAHHDDSFDKVGNINNVEVLAIFDSYPNNVRDHFYFLRQLVFETASELEITDLEETLKWGEPSYLTKKGSTLRISWRKSNPNQVALFFH